MSNQTNEGEKQRTQPSEMNQYDQQLPPEELETIHQEALNNIEAEAEHYDQSMAGASIEM